MFHILKDTGLCAPGRFQEVLSHCIKHKPSMSTHKNTGRQACFVVDQVIPIHDLDLQGLKGHSEK